MAAVNITINGVICDLYGRTITGPVKIVGEAMYSDRQVGGGPMPPGEGGAPPDLGIWPNPPEGIAPHPEHPIVYPPTEPPPDGPPDSDGFIKAPPAGGGWGFHQTYGWMLDPAPNMAQPKR